MKTCNKCKRNLDESNFSKKGKGLQSVCKACHKEYRDAHYQRNKDKYIQKTKERAAQYQEDYIKYKKTLSCNSCGESRYWLLEFHHTDSSKEFNISTKSSSMPLDTLKKEIDKCEVLCANCHRDRHYQERLASNA